MFTFSERTFAVLQPLTRILPFSWRCFAYLKMNKLSTLEGVPNVGRWLKTFTVYLETKNTKADVLTRANYLSLDRINFYLEPETWEEIWLCVYVPMENHGEIACRLAIKV